MLITYAVSKILINVVSHLLLPLLLNATVTNNNVVHVVKVKFNQMNLKTNNHSLRRLDSLTLEIIVINLKTNLLIKCL